MKVELKHLANYLPYGLNIKDVKHSSVFEALHFITTPHQDFSLFKGNLDQLINDKYLKPVLFPLSSLTKEMYYKLSGKNENDDFGFFYGKNNGDFDKRDYIYRQGYSGKTYMLEDGYYQFPYGMMDFFFKNKFDVFGLIEAGLAEAVTEDFNPYK